MNNQEHINSLLGLLTEYNRMYRLGKPIISDAEYDKLVAELRSLDPENDWFKTIEPAPISQSRKRRLPIPMKSLNKVKSVVEIQQWLNSLAIPSTALVVVTPKFDGVSWLHCEEDGRTYSRGGSENEGQLCTAHYLKGDFGNKEQWNQFFPPSHTFGELVFKRSVWESAFVGKKSDSTGEEYRSPRNTVAGFINRDEAPDDIKYADFFRYGIGEADLDNFSTYTELYDTLCRVYHQPNLKQTIPVKQLSEELLSEIFLKWRQEYYIDGLVIYLDSIPIWKAIGRQQTTGNPLYAMAYKHPDFTESFETTVKKIEWNVSKAGALKPVVQIEAVDTGDCTMENPTGYNAGWCLSHHIGTGARILVTRSGGVIPKILETLKPVECEIPKICPICGHPTAIDEKGIELYCTNTACEGRQLAKITHFLTTVGVENMGDESIAKIFNAGHKTIRSFLNIEWDELIAIEGFGESIANGILSQMNKIKGGVDLATLMHSSDCFKGIGKIKAQKLLDDMNDEELCSFCQGWFIRKDNVNPENKNFQALPITIQNFYLGYFPFMQFLEETGIPYTLPQKTVPTSSKCKGFAVCFSGIRDSELETKITSEGGSVVSGVSKKTTHLIVKDVSGTSTKITKAKQLGIRVIDIDNFKALV